jgi:hypothetical protein
MVDASDRVRFANADIVMFRDGPFVIASYQMRPAFSQLWPPMAVAALWNARFGMPLL